MFQEYQNLLKCYEELSKNVDYLPRYYFGFIYSENFKNFYNTKIPSIVLTGINYNDFKWYWRFYYWKPISFIFKIYKYIFKWIKKKKQFVFLH